MGLVKFIIEKKNRKIFPGKKLTLSQGQKYVDTKN